MSVYTQILGEHRWTKTMEQVATVCGECPVCMTRGVHVHTEFSGGDGERGYVEYECPECDAEWTDAYNLVTRTVYPAPTLTVDGEAVETMTVDEFFARCEAAGIAVPDTLAV